jgi:hypothetical protein
MAVVEDSGAVCDDSGMVGGLTGWLVLWVEYGVLRGKLGGFAVAAPQELQGFQQLVQDLWVDYLLGALLGKTPLNE